MLSSKAYRSSGLAWKPALSLAALLIGSYLAVFCCSTIAFQSVRNSRLQHGEMVIRSTKFQILSQARRSDGQLFPALDHWASDHDYVIAALVKGDLEDAHRLPPTPTQVTYESAVLWKPGLFDRLGLNGEGLFSKAPEILVQSASTQTGSYTWITLPTSSQNKAENNAGNALQEDLYHALSEDFAPKPPTVETAPPSAETPPDLSEPIGLLRAWADAYVAGDFPAAEALCIGPKQTLKIMEVQPEQVLELVRLNDAIDVMFNFHNPNIANISDQARELWRQLTISATILKTDPDHATAYPQDAGKMILCRIDGKWKLDWIASYLPPGYQAQAGDLALCRAFYVLPVQRLIENVQAGKYKTFDDAMAAYHHLQADWKRIPQPLLDDATRRQAAEVAGLKLPAATQPAVTQPQSTSDAESQHFYAIGREIVGVYTSPGSAAEGERLANEALQLAAKYPDNLVTLDALNQAHTVLGLVALKKGDLFSAKLELMQSISDRPSPILNSFGPKLELAAALLARGERQTVLEFLDECARDYPGTAETMHRRRDLVAAGQTPRELVYHDPAEPLYGRWISKKTVLYTLAVITFNPDGTATWAQGYRLAGQSKVADGKLSVTDAQTKAVSDLGAFSIDHDKLTFASWNRDVQNSSYTDGKPMIFNRAGSGFGLVGTWIGTAHLNDAGKEIYTLTVGADGSVALAEDVNLETMHYRYILDGTKLSYTLTARGMTRNEVASAVIDGKELVLNGFPLPQMGEIRLRRDSTDAAAITTQPASTQPGGGH